MELISQHGCHGDVQRFYRHDSKEIGLPMHFAVFLPPQAQDGGKLPVMFYLAGLTCTDDTFMIKAGAQRFAVEQGLMLVALDTSPRGADVPGEADARDVGVGAGFYVDAAEAPWSRYWRMESYIAEELFHLVTTALPGDADREGICGHSMGGHGALVLAQRNPERFRSVSAFAPITAPSLCPWGEKALTGYLGVSRSVWAEHDATALMRKQVPPFSRRNFDRPRVIGSVPARATHARRVRGSLRSRRAKPKSAAA